MRIFSQGSNSGSRLVFCSVLLLALIPSCYCLYISDSQTDVSFQIPPLSPRLGYSFYCPSVCSHSVYQRHQHLACTTVTLFPSLTSGISFVHICSILCLLSMSQMHFLSILVRVILFIRLLFSTTVCSS